MALQISNMQKQQKNSTFTTTKKVYIHKLDEIVDKYNNTVYCTIEIHIGVDTYINSTVEHNLRDLKFKVGDRVRISKYKNIYLLRQFLGRSYK